MEAVESFAAPPWPHRRFLEHAARHPECLDARSFPGHLVGDCPEDFPRQPWPLLMDRRQLESLGRAAIAVSRLVRSIPERLFGNDPGRIAEHYGLPREIARLTVELMQRTGCLPGSIGRGDFILTPEGLKCCELNLAGNLGGGELEGYSEASLADPPLQRFLAETGLRASFTHPSQVLATHLLEEADRRGLGDDGEVNLALVTEALPPSSWLAPVRQAWQGALAERHGRGGLFVARDAELRERGGRLWLGDRRIHLVIDANEGLVGRPLYLALAAGGARAFNGPVSPILSHKTNLALLSEMADAGELPEADRAIVHAHIPWSRRVEEGFADWRGERVYLPDLLAAERDRLVLKQGRSRQGKEVYVGRFVATGEWDEVARRALDEEGWIVQELLETVRYPFLLPDGGVGPFDLVWGLFVFGDHFGGTFLRLLPSGREGVINASRGAMLGVLLEVEPGS